MSETIKYSYACIHRLRKRWKVIETNYAQQKACNKLFKSKYIICWCGLFCSQTLIVILKWKQWRSVNTYCRRKHSTKRDWRKKMLFQNWRTEGQTLIMSRKTYELHNFWYFCKQQHMKCIPLVKDRL